MDAAEIESFPLIELDPEQQVELKTKLDDSIPKCRVNKKNAGKTIPNINFNRQHHILKEIDGALLSSLNHKPHPRIFGSKSNSLTGSTENVTQFQQRFSA